MLERYWSLLALTFSRIRIRINGSANCGTLHAIGNESRCASGFHDRHRIDGASFDQGVRNLLPELARRFLPGHDMHVSSEGSSPLVGIHHVYERPHHAPDRTFAPYSCLPSHTIIAGDFSAADHCSR
jgi:hypothetical protein